MGEVNISLKTPCAYTHTQHMGGSRVLEAVIHYPHDCIPGLDKRSYRHHHSEASTREVQRDLSRFSNKMPPPDNLSTAVAPFPHVLMHSQIRERGGREGESGRE